MSKKIYIASKFDNKDFVKYWMNRFELYGHIITCDWTVHKDIYPFYEHREDAKRYSEDDTKAILDCDIFIFLDDGDSGAFTEIGAAITSRIMTGRPEIYVISDIDKESMFFYHPMIEIKHNMDDILYGLEDS